MSRPVPAEPSTVVAATALRPARPTSAGHDGHQRQDDEDRRHEIERPGDARQPGGDPIRMATTTTAATRTAQPACWKIARMPRGARRSATWPYSSSAARQGRHDEGRATGVVDEVAADHEQQERRHDDDDERHDQLGQPQLADVLAVQEQHRPGGEQQGMERQRPATPRRRQSATRRRCGVIGHLRMLSFRNRTLPAG